MLVSFATLAELSEGVKLSSDMIKSQAVYSNGVH